MHPQALEDPSESTPELTHKASRQPVSACLTSSLWLLASCSSLTSPSFTWSCALNFASVWPLHWFHFLPDYNTWLLLCGIFGIFVAQVLLRFSSSDLLPPHTPAQSLKYLLWLQTHHSLSPQRFSLLSWHKCMFVHSFQRTLACISVHKHKVMHREIQTAHPSSTHPIAWPAG